MRSLERLAKNDAHLFDLMKQRFEAASAGSPLESKVDGLCCFFAQLIEHFDRFVQFIQFALNHLFSIL